MPSARFGGIFKKQNRYLIDKQNGVLDLLWANNFLKARLWLKYVEAVALREFRMRSIRPDVFISNQCLLGLNHRVKYYKSIDLLSPKLYVATE